jgi:hypothetical protein
VASPIALTETSMRAPWRAKAGRVAVTMTAATLRGRRVAASVASIATPKRSSMPMRLCWVNGEFVRVSPVVFRPTTMP